MLKRTGKLLAVIALMITLSAAAANAEGLTITSQFYSLKGGSFPNSIRTTSSCSNSTGSSCSTGTCTTGKCNTGSCSASACPTGNCTTGNCTTGNCTTGNCSTSKCNTGSCSTSNGNTNANTCNTGSCGSGNCNVSGCTGRNCATTYACLVGGCQQADGTCGGGSCAKTATKAGTSSSTVGHYTIGSPSAQEKEAAAYVNEDRQKYGRAALPLDAELCALARMKSKDMLQNRYFAHTSPTLGSAAQMLRNNGYAFTSVGENIARHATVLKSHAAFMSSAGHKNNILGSQWKKMGIGIALDANGYVYVTQLFVR